MRGRDIIVIGGSTGALDALKTLLERLPADLPAAVFVVLHAAADAPGVLDRILRLHSRLPVNYAADQEPIRPGHVFLAPPDRHLLVKARHMRLAQGPRENRFRPAVDLLFRTAARAHRGRVVAVLLSGGQDDGAAGMAVVKEHGGVAIVQHPDEALVPSMPLAALRHVAIDHTIGARDMPAVLAGLTRDGVETDEGAMEDYDLPRDIAEAASHDIHRADALGPPSPFTCPDCGGALWQSKTGEVLGYHCHLGHRYGAESLEAGQAEAVEGALWTALRALEERVELRRRMARDAEARGLPTIAREFASRAEETEQQARIIRRVLLPEPRAVEAEEPTSPIR